VSKDPLFGSLEPDLRYEEFWRALQACQAGKEGNSGDGVVHELAAVENGSPEPATLFVHFDPYGRVGFYTVSELGGPAYVSRRDLVQLLEQSPADPRGSAV
jgi:hypothetical protein